LSRLGAWKQSSVLLADRSIHAHLSKCTVILLFAYRFRRITHTREVPHCEAVLVTPVRKCKSKYMADTLNPQPPVLEASLQGSDIKAFARIGR